jgi:N-methylhydantoinase A
VRGRRRGRGARGAHHAGAAHPQAHRAQGGGDLLRHSETDKADLERINALLDEMEAAARKTLRREGVPESQIRIQRSVDMRYYGQFRDRNAPLGAGPVTGESLQAALRAFHQVHEQTVGYADPAYPTEIVRLHVSGSASTQPPKLQPIAASAGIDAARKGRRPAYFSGAGFIDTPVYDGERLGAGARVEGPAIIEEVFTTFVLPPGACTEVDLHGNFVTTSQEA